MAQLHCLRTGFRSDDTNSGVLKHDRSTSSLTFRHRIKSRLPFAGIIRRLTYSTRFQDKG